MYVSINLPMCSTNTVINVSGDRGVTGFMYAVRFLHELLSSGTAFFRNRLLYILIKPFLASQCVPSPPFFYEDIGNF